MSVASFPPTSDQSESLRTALQRLLEQRATPADIETLRRALTSGQIAIASGERAAALGEGVHDVVVVTGDNNIVQVFKGPDADAIRQTFRQVLAEIEADRYARALKDYFAALREYCRNLPYLTLHDIRPPKTLDEVYVPLKAQPREHKEETESPPQEREILGPLSIAEVLQQGEHAHLLILGEPGAGKSTLLRQLAEHAWDAPHKIGLTAPHLPLLVPLRRLALEEGSLEERLNRALASEMTLPRELPAGFFDSSQQNGAPWLLLFDGLDEVPADRRAELMQWLKGSLRWLQGNRLILTSRPSGYTRGELDEKLVGHYEILPFTPEQSREFAKKWFKEQADAFLQELARVRAGALSGTPLLLTIAAKVYLEEQTLPARRSALYDQFVDIWLREATEHRGLKNELGERICKVARFALGRLALAMTERVGAISETELFQCAAEYLRDALGLREDEAEVDGKKFVQVMARRSGVFLRRGEMYDWIHLTFREYLAAETIVRACEQDLERVWERAVSRWKDENRHEVALFTLSVLSDAEKDVTALVERIWQEGDEGLYFAGDALAEQVRIQDALGRQIIAALLDRARRMSWRDLFGNNPIIILGELRGYPEVAERLLALARDERVDEWVRVGATAALGKLGRVEEAVEILLALAWDEGMNAGVRVRAAESLGKLGRVKELLALARDGRVNAWLRAHAAETLGKLGRVDEAAEILLTLARDKRVEAWDRKCAATALGKLGCVGEAAQAWLALARDKRLDIKARQEAAEALAKLGRVDEAAEILLALARDERVDEEVRERAAEALGELGRVDEAAQAWLALARGARVDAWVRKDAAEALGKLGRVDEATEILLTLARDARVDAWTREWAAEALGKLGCVDEATEILLTLARDARVDAWTREWAAEALGKLGRVDEATEILLTLARDARVDARTSEQAAKALGKLGCVDEAAEILLALARDARVDARVRRDAAEALGELGRVDEAAQAWLALARGARVDAWVRKDAAEALGELGRVDEAAQVWLALARGARVDAWVRKDAAEALGRWGRVEELLALARDAQVDTDVREQAAKALGKLGRVDEAAAILLTLARDVRVNAWTRERAAEALGKVGRVNEAVAILLALARDEQANEWVRGQAAKVLGRLGDTRLLPDLEQIAREDADANVREAAQTAIEKIRQRTASGGKSDAKP